MPAGTSLLSKTWRYLLQDSNNPRTNDAIRLLIMGTGLVVGAWFTYFVGTAIAFPYPVEYREGASLVMTRFFLEGMNPFALENQPLGMNNYGIGYSLTVLPLAALFGNTLLIHRLVTSAFILLSFLLVFGVALSGSRHAGVALVCGELVAIGLATLGGLGAFPTSMGAFFFLASVLIPFRRAFDNRGLILSTFLCLVAFFTKPYFMLGFGIVASYLFLFKSRTKALFYALMFLVAFAASFLLTNSLFPLYYFDTIGSNLSQAALDSGHMLAQLGRLVAEFYPGMIALILVLIASLPLRRLGVVQSADSARISDGSALRGPLISIPVNYFAYCFVISLVAFVVLLGPNPGSFMTYCYQLILPFFLLWLFREVRPRRRLELFLLPLLLVNLVSFCAIRLNPAFLRQFSQSREAWEGLYALVEQSNRMLNSPVLSAEITRRGLWPVDSGQTEYYFWTVDDPASSLLGPSQEAIRQNGQLYLSSIRADIANREFDSITLTEGADFLVDHSLLRRHYHRTGRYSIHMPLVAETWNIVTWEPDEE